MRTIDVAGRRIRLLREEACLSRQALARRARTTEITLETIEAGERAAWPVLRASLARELGVSEAVLFPEVPGP